ncbi:MAG: homoserine dehydrogenase [Chloroflexi bacterium]|nr:homoserine dehydrogenase [Chloroflexota bacterium]
MKSASSRSQRRNRSRGHLLSSRNEVVIGLMGLGVVGSGVAQGLLDKARTITNQVGCPVNIKKVLMRDDGRTRPVPGYETRLTTNAEDILSAPDIDIVIELMGGEDPAYQYIRRALSLGKHVVTANKEVIAKHSAELIALAQEKERDLRFEASVGGGIPLIAPFRRDLAANDLSALHAIINGTTNYILTRMGNDGLDFSAALQQAQQFGYAEADPTNDVEGKDAVYKLAIMATLAFHTPIYPDDIYREGITRLAARDFRYAKELGFTIKLLAIARRENGVVQARVHPVFVPQDAILAKVDGVFNAVQVEGDLVGKVLFYGRGAGSLPTSSAVLADVINIAQRINHGVNYEPRIVIDARKSIKSMSDLETRYYFRMSVADRYGVLAEIAKTFGDHLISISSVLQKESDERTRTAEIVITTHPAREAAVQQALRELQALPVVREIGNFVRMEAQL